MGSPIWGLKLKKKKKKKKKCYSFSKKISYIFIFSNYSLMKVVTLYRKWFVFVYVIFKDGYPAARILPVWVMSIKSQLL